MNAYYTRINKRNEISYVAQISRSVAFSVHLVSKGVIAFIPGIPLSPEKAKMDNLFKTEAEYFCVIKFNNKRIWNRKIVKVAVCR